MHLQTFHIMADIHIDIERMIMHSNYLLEVDNSSASNGLSDMERKQYLDQIKDLVQTVQTLLDANIAWGPTFSTHNPANTKYDPATSTLTIDFIWGTMGTDKFFVCTYSK